MQWQWQLAAVVEEAVATAGGRWSVLSGGSLQVAEGRWQAITIIGSSADKCDDGRCRGKRVPHNVTLI